MKTIILSCWMLAGLSVSLWGQQSESLQNLTDEELLSRFDELSHDSLAAEPIARIYLERARQAGDTIKMARGYDRLARIFSPEKNIQFADSIITLTTNLKHITYPALGHILKGFNAELDNDLIMSTQSYLEAYRISRKSGNTMHQVYVLDQLIFNKAIWGNGREALKLQRKRDEIVDRPEYKNEISKSSRPGIKVDLNEIILNNKIVSHQNFAFIFLNLKEIDSARLHYEKAVALIHEYDGFHKINNTNWMTEFGMELEFYSNNFKRTIDLSDFIITEHQTFGEDALFNAYMFKGLSKVSLSDEVMPGLKSLHSADSIFDNGNIVNQPYKRILFETLLSNSLLNRNETEQMKYLGKLIAFDSVMRVNYQYFEPELIKELQTNELIAQQQELLERLDRNKRISGMRIGGLLVLVLVSLWAVFYYYRKHVLYRKRYEALKQNPNGVKPRRYKSGQEISDEVIREILDRLEKFELEKGYLSSGISLNSVARSFGTNAKYLSSVVNLNKGKNFSQYLNALRTSYAFERLRKDRRFRRYTIRAIAGESGFNRAESFSKAFYRNFGIYPSYYIRKLEKEKGQTTVSPAAPLAD